MMQNHPKMPADEIAKLADCGVATVYRINERQSKAPAFIQPR